MASYTRTRNASYCATRSGGDQGSTANWIADRGLFEHCGGIVRIGKIAPLVGESDTVPPATVQAPQQLQRFVHHEQMMASQLDTGIAALGIDDRRQPLVVLGGQTNVAASAPVF